MFTCPQRTWLGPVCNFINVQKFCFDWVHTQKSKEHAKTTFDDNDDDDDGDDDGDERG